MIRFLIKGLIRDRQRSLFPILIVTIGVWITVFLHAYINGVFGDLIDSTARFSTGHVLVMSQAYAENKDQMPNDLALSGVDLLLTDLRRQYPKMTWTPRIHFGGLLDIPDVNGETRAQAPVFGFGVDLLSAGSPEIAIMNIKKALVRGRLPQNPTEILISDNLAQKLEIGLNDTATLLGSTMYGGMSMYNFKVVGTIRFGLAAMDRSAIIADIGDVRKALDMQDATGEILGFQENNTYNDTQAAKIVKEFNARYLKKDDPFSPVMATLKEASDLSEYLDMAENYSGTLVFIFVLVMSIVLWNAGLLGSLRRYGEVGIRLALGENKGAVYRSMIFESVFIGLIGSIFGSLLGLGSAYWLQTQGLDISSLLKNINMMFPGIIRAHITGQTFYIGFFPGLVSTVMGTVLAGIGIYKRQTASLFQELDA